MKLLLENGADPNYEEHGQHPVFKVAEMYPMLHGEDFLTGYDETVAEGITQIVQMLSKDISIDLQSPLGNTVLMCAAKRGNLVLIEYCIAQGCNVDITNKAGQTAYEIAVEANKYQSAERIKAAKTEARAAS